MASVVGAKAVALLDSDGITEDCTARTFYARGSTGGVEYTVTSGRKGIRCTCTAGQAARPCYHAAGVMLLLQRETETHRAMQTAAA